MAFASMLSADVRFIHLLLNHIERE